MRTAVLLPLVVLIIHSARADVTQFGGCHNASAQTTFCAFNSSYCSDATMWRTPADLASSSASCVCADAVIGACYDLGGSHRAHCAVGMTTDGTDNGVCPTYEEGSWQYESYTTWFWISPNTVSNEYDNSCTCAADWDGGQTSYGACFNDSTGAYHCAISHGVSSRHPYLSDTHLLTRT